MNIDPPLAKAYTLFPYGVTFLARLYKLKTPLIIG